MNSRGRRSFSSLRHPDWSPGTSSPWTEAGWLGDKSEAADGGAPGSVRFQETRTASVSAAARTPTHTGQRRLFAASSRKMLTAFLPQTAYPG